MCIKLRAKPANMASKKCMLYMSSMVIAITTKDCEGWVRHTDDFCIKIANRDAATLKEYEIDL